MGIPKEGTRKKKGSDPGSNPGGAIIRTKVRYQGGTRTSLRILVGLFLKMLKEQKREGKSLKKSLLEKFLEKKDGEEVFYRDFRLIRHCLIYEGREHDDYEVILEKKGE